MSKLDLRYLSVLLLVIFSGLTAILFENMASPGQWSWWLAGAGFGIGPGTDFVTWLSKKLLVQSKEDTI